MAYFRRLGVPVALLGLASVARAQNAYDQPTNFVPGMVLAPTALPPLGQRTPDALILARPDVQAELRLSAAQRRQFARFGAAVHDRQAVIDDAACRAHLGVRFGGVGTRIEPRNPGVRGALGRILCNVSDAMSDGSWERMKACRADDCKYAFYDTAKNKSRAWCSMQSCGNRAKVHAYRERQQA